jgi:hypothetical protein
MKTELHEAFTDSPPTLSTGETMANYSQRIAILVSRALNIAGEESDAMAIAAYIAVSRSLLRPSLDQLEEIMMEVSDDDVDAISGYIERVIDRRNEAKVEAAETPGK